MKTSTAVAITALLLVGTFTVIQVVKFADRKKALKSNLSARGNLHCSACGNRTRKENLHCGV